MNHGLGNQSSSLNQDACHQEDEASTVKALGQPSLLLEKVEALVMSTASRESQPKSPVWLPCFLAV